ncbi:hypothetical protein TWF217_001505 [Orbilia oligospora]|nr:hypothetical protein TWF217_001505 [Orbilia oligospora]
MCLPRLSLVEKYDDDTGYTNSRPAARRPSAVRGSVYLPRNSLRSLKSKYSHSSASEAPYYDHDLGQFTTRRNGYHTLHGNRGDSKTIVVDNSSAKKSGNGATAVEISDGRNGTTTTILSANGRQSNSSLKSVGFNKYKFEKIFTTPESDEESSSDDDDNSSTSSTDSDDSHRSRRGHEYPLYHQQQVVPVPMAVPAQMMQAYPQNMSSFIQPQRQIGTGLITTPPQQMVMQPVPQVLTQDHMHGIHGQYYQGHRVGPTVPQTMVPISMVGPHHLLTEAEEDQG